MCFLHVCSSFPCVFTLLHRQSIDHNRSQEASSGSGEEHDRFDDDESERVKSQPSRMPGFRHVDDDREKFEPPRRSRPGTRTSKDRYVFFRSDAEIRVIFFLTFVRLFETRV